ncbi:hypothetical protein [Cohnella zeiphila]|uniref:Uncharacterized protein n=1 Tax=Cohnella zeiphila TaxID=2761120 RepID=A0A7X0SL75_9BACL|nr:hypothetical protein [Cohnella zeiphila]MBB6732057.1 hypothetical protein [Cohnella zeiphila]
MKDLYHFMITCGNFRSLSEWLTSVLERGVQHGQLQLTSTSRADAEALMAAVHGTMLSARMAIRRYSAS